MFINAFNEVTLERGQSFLADEHVERIVKTYEKFKDEPRFTRVAKLEVIRAKYANLSIPLYVAPQTLGTREERAEYVASGLSDALSAWLESLNQVQESLQDAARATQQVNRALKYSLFLSEKRVYFPDKNIWVNTLNQLI